MDAAYKRGIILVAAAGNCRGGPVSYPARYRSIIAVSAIDSNNRAAFSCKGPKVELCATGVNIYSTLPGNKYGTKSGTSMAAPHVAGTVALAISSHRYVISHAGPQIFCMILGDLL
jgi:subtilisin